MVSQLRPSVSEGNHASIAVQDAVELTGPAEIAKTWLST